MRIIVLDPHNLDADRDSTIALMRTRILIFYLMRIRILFDLDADPDRDPTFHFTLMQIRIQILASKYSLKPLKKCSNRLIFHTFWLVMKLIRIGVRFRIQLTTLMRIRILILI
jgi:hypothetical protein